MMRFIPDDFKTQDMCNDASGDGPGLLEHVPGHFKTKRMCDKAAKGDRWQLKYKICVTKQLRNIQFYWGVSQVSLKPNRC